MATAAEYRDAADTRRATVRERVIGRGGLRHGDIAELARELGVSDMTISRDISYLQREATLNPVEALSYHLDNSLHDFESVSYDLSPEQYEERAAAIRQHYADATLKLLADNQAEMDALVPADTEPVDMLSHAEMLAAGQQLPALREATGALTTKQVLARARNASTKAEAFSWISIVSQRVPLEGVTATDGRSGYSPATAIETEAKEVLAALEDKIRGPRKPVDGAHVAAVRRERVAAMKLLSKLSAAQDLNDRRARYTASF